MRVLLISHTCQSKTEGLPKAQCLGAIPGIELCVLVPDRWKHYGRWRTPDVPEQASYQHHIGKVAMPWMGPAQFYLHYYPRLESLLREFRPDVIDLWEEPWALVSAQACRLRNRWLPNTKIVSETEQNINKKLPPPFEFFRSYTLRRADFAVGRSDQAVQVLRDKGYPGPAESVPNAVDAELFHPMDKPTCRREMKLEGFIVGYVGRLVEEKGLMDLVDALPLCPPETRILMVGSGPFQPALQARIRELDLENRVTILPARPLEQLPVLMNALDVLVLPSRTTARWKEQFGRVLIEAQACQVPVIGSSSGAIPDVVGQGGLVVPEANPKALAAAICKLRSDASLALNMGFAGRCQVEQKYTWSNVARRMQEIYLRVLSLPGKQEPAK